jgi:hypothetical protein
MTDSDGTMAKGLLEEQVAALLSASGLDEVVKRSRQLAVVEEIVRTRPPSATATMPDPERLAYALERLGLELRDVSERTPLFDEAFLCRRSIDLSGLSSQERLSHLVCLAADALAAGRRPELIMLLRELDDALLVVPEDVNWPEELQLRTLRAFLLMARRSDGWDDVQRASSEVARLRELQASREAHLLDDASAPLVSSLVCLYNLARSVEMTADYLVSGSPADIGVRLDRHHANVSEILDLEPNPAFAHTVDLIHLGLRNLVDASIWTVTRGLGQRISRFVDVLVASARDNPVLELWPSQRSALRSSLLDPAKRALVVQMPTSAGKTLVAEFAIVQALALNPDATVAYVVPTRALVNQITLRLREDLGPLDLEIEAAVPVFELDPVEDELLQGKRIHALVTTPEKLDLLIRQDHPSVRKLAMVVADEAHNLGDGERGARLELVLGTVKRERAEARFILLSPFLPNANEIADWLASDPDATVSVDWKPTELVTGAVTWTKQRGQPYKLQLTTIPSAHFVELGSEVELSLGVSTVQPTSRSKSAISTSAALRLAERGSVLVLCRGRGTAEQRAAQIAAGRDERALSALGQAVVAYAESELGQDDPLPNQLRRGVAFHHAGLSHDLRFLIERLVDREDVQIVCGTTTLAQGVNFPIANVLLETLQKPGERPIPWVELSYAEFWNIAGRAGRAMKDRMGLVVYPATTSGKVDPFRQFLQRDAQELASALVGALEAVDAATSTFDLAWVRKNRAMAVFTQYLTHALSVGGYETARADVEDLLRSSLVYHQAQAVDPVLARELITLARRYLDSVSDKTAGYLRLADGTGFSLSSVDLLYAQQRGEHREFERQDFWSPAALFSPDLENLTNVVGVLSGLPELNLGVGDTGPFNPRIVAGVISDWVGGVAVSEIAERWFSTAETDPEKRRRLAARYLYTTLIGQVPWGIGAVQRLALSDDEDLRAVGHVPSLIFYGVRSREAAALRMAGVPRLAAEGMGVQLAELATQQGEGFHGLRTWLEQRSDGDWQQALPRNSPIDGPGARRVWRTLAGLSST